MDLPVFLNKWIIGFKPIKYTPFWWWYRLMCHEGFRFDDYGIWGEFWHTLNHGWQHMEYVHNTEKFQEEFAKSQVFDADKFEEENRKERSARILSRYNDYHNLETSGLSHGMPTSIEELQCIAFRSMIDTMKCEHLNQEYTHIAIDDIEDLIDGLYQQGKDYLERVRKLKGEDK